MWGTRVPAAGAVVLTAFVVWFGFGPGRASPPNQGGGAPSAGALRSTADSSESGGSPHDASPDLPPCDGPASAVASPPLVVLRAALDDPTCAATVWWDRTTAELSVPTADGQRRRYRLGAPDDQVVLGDWDCDGRATPGVYRPATGDTFLFATWPSTTEPEPAVRADSTAVTDGVATVVSSAPGTSCQQLRIDP